MTICRTCIKVDGLLTEANDRFRSWARIEGLLSGSERREKAEASERVDTAWRLQAAHRRVCKIHNA